MTTDHTRYTLGELLAHHNTIIARAAMSILKTLQRIKYPCLLCDKVTNSPACDDCNNFVAKLTNKNN